MFAAKDSLLTRPSGGYQISRSLRFNSADSAYLNRTPASATNRQIFTWSAWVKIGKFVADSILISSGNGSSAWGNIEFNSNAITIIEVNPGVNYYLVTTQLFRDPSAWYHLVVAFDTTQATASNRIKLYVNGVQVTSFTTSTYPSQNYNTWYNSATQHGVGRLFDGLVSYYFDGYQTEVNLIDGQALTPSSFGETNAQTGVWQPKAYSGSYGTNGFYLNFSDNSNTTAATLGKDYSGNGNNWTPNNFSVTAGAGNDSLVDVPTPYGVDTGVGGTVRGNYCTLNPLIVNYQTTTYTNGNLEGRATGGGWSGMQGTLSVSTGKWYWEVNVTTSDNIFVGIARTTMNFATINPQNVSGSVVYFAIDGHKRVDGTDTTYGATFAIGDIIGVALDLDANTVTFYKNNASQGAISLASTTLNGTSIIPLNVTAIDGTIAVCNFGQRPFVYTAPSGFKALCTQNLPTPTIGATTATQAGKFFNPVTFTSPNGGAVVTGVGFQPDFTWNKARSTAESHLIFDAVRGNSTYLITNNTNVEATFTNGWIPSSDGFTIAVGGLSSSQTYVAWNWKANGSGSSNTSGSITSTVSANTTSGFSVVTYTGTGANATVGHGLGVAPSMVITKSRSDVGGWAVYHISTGASYYLLLNGTSTAANEPTLWNNTAPTSTRFSIGTSGAANTSAATYVAYCFAPIAGYSAFGSYTGNGSADGVFVYTGFRPAFVMVKRTDSTSDWYIWDTKRDTYNVVTNTLLPNSSGAETSATSIDDLSNGFKCRSATVVNASGGTYIYMAFAEAPQKFSLAR